MASNSPPPPGAIARLLTAQALRKGMSKRRLARLVDSDDQRIGALLRGWTYQGVRALGIISRVPDRDPLLVSVARVLEIPTEELALAIAEDIGLPAPVSSGATLVYLSCPSQSLRRVA